MNKDTKIFLCFMCSFNGEEPYYNIGKVEDLDEEERKFLKTFVRRGSESEIISYEERTVQELQKELQKYDDRTGHAIERLSSLEAETVRKYFVKEGIGVDKE